jgi:calcineurin-like phosphoesterase family protein
MKIMTMITEIYRIKEEGTVVSLCEFLNETEWHEAFCKRYPEYHDNDDFDIHAHISSDMCEIEAMLQADHRIWSVEWIEEADYFLIREWEKVE